MLDVLYTAVGGRDATTPRFTQRIVATTARVGHPGGRLTCVDRTAHREVLGAHGVIYERTDAADGEPGLVKAFRDPFPFRDPADGREWLLFAGSKADALQRCGGPRGGDAGWRLSTRAAAVARRRRQQRTGAAARRCARRGLPPLLRRSVVPSLRGPGPTGLYGFGAPAFRGPYAPINGSGLVLRNRDAEPAQAYTWLVLPDLRVSSFVDFHSLAGGSADEVAAAGADAARRYLGGTLAPIHRLRLDGATAVLVG